MLRREAIKNGDDLDSGIAGNGNRLGVRAGIGVEAAAMEIDEDFVAVRGWYFRRSDNTHGYAGDLVLSDLIGADL